MGGLRPWLRCQPGCRHSCGHDGAGVFGAEASALQVRRGLLCQGQKLPQGGVYACLILRLLTCRPARAGSGNRHAALGRYTPRRVSFMHAHPRRWSDLACAAELRALRDAAGGQGHAGLLGGDFRLLSCCGHMLAGDFASLSTVWPLHGQAGRTWGSLGFSLPEGWPSQAPMDTSIRASQILFASAGTSTLLLHQGWVGLHEGRLMRTEGLRKADARSVHAGGHKGDAARGFSPRLRSDTSEHCCLAHALQRLLCHIHCLMFGHIQCLMFGGANAVCGSLCFRSLRSRPKDLQGLQSHWPPHGWL